ncbi:hypothetical protein [Bosea sp. LjRoot237]|uniref:hypothetical protein n=1 Tax=Bosea sp. LjRoot237 TaxID=3342292 RepID=UPI003ECCA0DE
MSAQRNGDDYDPSEFGGNPMSHPLSPPWMHGKTLSDLFAEAKRNHEEDWEQRQHLAMLAAREVRS